MAMFKYNIRFVLQDSQMTTKNGSSPRKLRKLKKASQSRKNQKARLKMRGQMRKMKGQMMKMRGPMMKMRGLLMKTRGQMKRWILILMLM